MTQLALAFLGDLRITLDDLSVTTFESDKVRALLVYLAVEARPHRRATLANLLWPDMPEASARHNLSQVLFNLRQGIGDHVAQPSFLLISRDSIQFNAASNHTLDVASFTGLLAACEQHTHAQLEHCADCTTRMKQAIDMYQGAFLAQFFLADSATFEEWAVLQREHLHRRALTAMTHLANYYEQGAEPAAALRICERQLAFDPWHEEAHQQMMRLLTVSGQRSAALAHYEVCRRLLTNELGVEPSAATQALYAQIRAGEIESQREKATKNAGEPIPSLLRPPAPSALPALPPQLTPLIGRTRELEESKHLLEDPACRLLSLVGAGGIGKTRLALGVAAQQAENRAQEVAFVALTPVVSREPAITAIADALGIVLYQATDRAAQLVYHLRAKRMLLVLDNFEQLLTDAPSIALVSELLASASSLKLLITTREPLQVQAEWVYPVQGLAIPANAVPAEMESSSAAMLFLQRAGQMRVGFTLTAEDYPAVIRICQLVEGLPLGIELAAAWVRVLACHEIADEIQRNIDFLSLAERDGQPRHRSMRAVFDHSWRLLRPEEQRSLAQLSIFRGGCRREAAASVANANLAILASLIDKSLVRKTQNAAGTRYDLHELLRQYAAFHLSEDTAEEQAARDRYSHYYLTLLQMKRNELMDQRQKEAIAELNPEIDNLNAAWDQALQRQHYAQLTSAVWSIYRVYELNSFEFEGENFFRRSVATLEKSQAKILAAGTDPMSQPEQEQVQALLGTLLSYQAYFSYRQGRTEQAVALYESCLALLYPLGLSEILGETLTFYGSLQWSRGHYAEAKRLLDESFEPLQQANNQWQLTRRLIFLGLLAYDQGDEANAFHLLNDAIARARSLGSPRLFSFSAGQLGRIAYRSGRMAEVEPLLAESLCLARETNDPLGTALTLEQLAAAQSARGESAEVQRLLAECIERYRSIGDRWCLARCYNLQGMIALKLGKMIEAQSSFQQAYEIVKSTGYTPDRLEAIVGLATCTANTGEPERALELVLLVVDHTAATHQLLERAIALRTRVMAQLSAEQVAQVQQRVQSGSIERLWGGHP